AQRPRPLVDDIELAFGELRLFHLHSPFTAGCTDDVAGKLLPRRTLQPTTDGGHEGLVECRRGAIVHLDLEAHRVAFFRGEHPYRAGDRMPGKGEHREALVDHFGNANLYVAAQRELQRQRFALREERRAIGARLHPDQRRQELGEMVTQVREQLLGVVLAAAQVDPVSLSREPTGAVRRTPLRLVVYKAADANGSGCSSTRRRSPASSDVGAIPNTSVSAFDDVPAMTLPSVSISSWASLNGRATPIASLARSPNDATDTGTGACTTVRPVSSLNRRTRSFCDVRSLPARSSDWHRRSSRSSAPARAEARS